MGGARDNLEIRDRPDCVGCMGHRHQASPRRQLPAEVIEIERALRRPDVGEPHDNPLLLQRQPGRYVAVVFEAGHHDFVPRPQLPGDGAADGERQRGHVRPEDDLFRRPGVHERGRRSARLENQRVRALAGSEDAAVVGVHRLPVSGGPIDHPLGYLGAGRIVQVDDRPAIDPQR